MTLLLFEKSRQLVEKGHPMSSNLWLFPKTVSCLPLHCLTSCSLPRTKIFQQNGGANGGLRIKTIHQLVSSSWFQKYRMPKFFKNGDKSDSVILLHIRSCKTKINSWTPQHRCFLNSSNPFFESDAWIRFYADNERSHWTSSMSTRSGRLWKCLLGNKTL